MKKLFYPNKPNPIKMTIDDLLNMCKRKYDTLCGKARQRTYQGENESERGMLEIIIRSLQALQSSEVDVENTINEMMIYFQDEYDWQPKTDVIRQILSKHLSTSKVKEEVKPIFDAKDSEGNRKSIIQDIG